MTNKTQIERYDAITVDLQKMVDEDQAMRNVARDEVGRWDESIDIRDTIKLKEIVGEIGWPTISKVGKTGSYNAWLLVQHADHDIEFQKECLRLMKSQPSGEIDIANIAYLEDRIAVAEERPQTYGTQFYLDSSDVWEPRPIVDPKNLNKRRTEVGLESFSEYQKKMQR